MGDVSILGPVGEVLGVVRRAKTEAKLSQRAAVEALTVEGPRVALDAIAACRADLAEAGAIAAFELSEGDTLLASVRLSPSTDSQGVN
jgi:valyl-tRNA synthetase